MAAELDPLTPAYEAMGVEGYYLAHGATYRNPHEDGVRGVLTMAVAAWTLDLSYVLDLACGSGEATLALRELGAGRTVCVERSPKSPTASWSSPRTSAQTFAAVGVGNPHLSASSNVLVLACTAALELSRIA